MYVRTCTTYVRTYMYTLIYVHVIYVLVQMYIQNYCSFSCSQHYPIVEIAIRSCKSGGIDTKVHGVSVLGRVDMNEDEVAANFSFLTFNDAVPETGIVRRQHRKRMDTLDSHGNKVFVWGLNDRTQLGSGISETKVRTYTCTCITYVRMYNVHVHVCFPFICTVHMTLYVCICCIPARIHVCR